MINNTIYEFLDVLAEQHIPKGKHRLLHVDARKAWVDMMVILIDNGHVAKKLLTIKKYARHWETMLTQRISIQN